MIPILRRIALLMVLAASAHAEQAPAPYGMTLTSASFEDGAVIPDKYTQSSAAPVSPALAWDHVPDKTVSFALIVHDPDTAPQSSTSDVLHWMMFNIPGAQRALAESIPAEEKLADGSIQGKNTAKSVGYRGMGARAPGPYHHYVFELFALDTKLELGPDASRADVLKAMEGHVLAKAVDTGRFHR